MTAEDRAEAGGLPQAGAVVGMDVGYSKRRRSSAVCLLAWDACQISWMIRRFRALREEQEESLTDIAGAVPLEAAAFDGPL
jgi:hypothetical protein